MKIATIDQAIQACESHLVNSNAKGTEIEAYLTRYLLVLMCSSFEEMIEKIVIERAQKSNDSHLVSFVRSSVGHLFRSIKNK
ncbi:MAG: hypothetical protein ACE5EK_08080 [Nitrospinales bacterium]